AADGPPPADTPLAKLRQQLARPVNLEKGLDANTPLKDALLFIRDRYGVPVLLDTAAFKSDLNIADVEAQPVRLPPLVGVRLGTVLDKLAASVQGSYLVRDDHVEMTTPARFRAAVWGLVEEGSIASRLRLPVVQAGIHQRPLDAALAELAEATGY